MSNFCKKSECAKKLKANLDLILLGYLTCLELKAIALFKDYGRRYNTQLRTATERDGY